MINSIHLIEPDTLKITIQESESTTKRVSSKWIEPMDEIITFMRSEP
jgi:hypothetical protein